MDNAIQRVVDSREPRARHHVRAAFKRTSRSELRRSRGRQRFG